MVDEAKFAHHADASPASSAGIASPRPHQPLEEPGDRIGSL